jgi:hypothetical protein
MALAEREVIESLDCALEQLRVGGSVEAVLEGFPPETAFSLAPLLQTAEQVMQTSQPVPDPKLKDKGLKALSKAARQHRNLKF